MERPLQDDAVAVEPVPSEEGVASTGELDEALETNRSADAGRTSRRLARAEKHRRPRAPLAENRAVPPDPAASATVESAERADGSPPETNASSGEAGALVIAFPGQTQKQGIRTGRRARNKEEAAKAAIDGVDDHPALGALNRHLNMLMQQLETAHRVIGRVAAERDALRQQLADLQGIPVEKIVVTSVGASTDQLVKGAQADQPLSEANADEPESPSLISRLNYFSAEDIAVTRRRRQMFALAILLLVFMLGIAGLMGLLQIPANLSRDTMGTLPVIGNFLTILFAGWMFFRVFRIGGKGVRWIFPKEDRHRKRR